MNLFLKSFYTVEIKKIKNQIVARWALSLGPRPVTIIVTRDDGYKSHPLYLPSNSVPMELKQAGLASEPAGRAFGPLGSGPIDYGP